LGILSFNCLYENCIFDGNSSEEIYMNTHEGLNEDQKFSTAEEDYLRMGRKYNVVLSEIISCIKSVQIQ
jgi:hypothetical protein